MTLKKCVYASNSMMCAERKSKTGTALKRKEERMEKKVIETINALCDWIQTELKNASSVQTESILPAVIEATANLVEQANHIY